MKRFIGLLLLCCSTAAANLITNGSFESGTFTGSSFTRVAAGQTNLTGWTVLGVAVDWHNTNEFGPMHDGTRALDLNLDGGTTGTGVLQQSFSSVIGSSYLLRFFAAAPTVAGLGTRSMRASLGSGLNLDIVLTNSPQRAMVWTEYSLRFNALSTTSTVSFSSLNGAGFWGPVIDSVSVVADNTGVPEGNSGWLLAGGLSCFLIARKVQKLHSTRGN